MRNIGAEMERKLNTIGIISAEELTERGSKDAFFHLKSAYPNVCLVHLYTLQGAIDDTDFNRLPQDTKNDLKAFSDSLK
ncbi:MAG: TfoX/Sxy family DNA transformation protein [Oscillospiraceae bacterium]